jgi:hypothetical protein
VWSLWGVAIAAYIALAWIARRHLRSRVYGNPQEYWTGSDERRWRTDRIAANLAGWGFFVWFVGALVFLGMAARSNNVGTQTVVIVFWGSLGFYLICALGLTRPKADKSDDVE